MGRRRAWAGDLRALALGVLGALGALSSGCGKGTMVADAAVSDGAPVDVLSVDVAPSVPGAALDLPGLSTLAGSGEAGLVDGPGSSALFSDPVNVAVGPDGYLYVADFKNGAVRRLTEAGDVRTLARGLTAPAGLAFDVNGALIVTGDDGLLRRIDVGTGRVSVIASGLGLARGVAALPDGRFVTTALDQDVVWLVQAGGGKTVLAGADGEAGLVDGVGAAARFDQPIDIVLSGGTLLVADLGNDRIRTVTLDGEVGTFAGTAGGYLDGALAVARFDGPSGLALDGEGDVFVSDRFNYRIREITAAGRVVTVAGDGTQGFADATAPLSAELAGIEGIDFAAPGLVYVADGNALVLGAFHRVRVLRVAP